MRNRHPLDTEWLKERLKEEGRSQSALARHMNLHPSAINRLVNGTRLLKARENDLLMEYIDSTKRDKKAASLSRKGPVKPVLPLQSLATLGSAASENYLGLKNVLLTPDEIFYDVLDNQVISGLINFLGQHDKLDDEILAYLIGDHGKMRDSFLLFYAVLASGRVDIVFCSKIWYIANTARTVLQLPGVTDVDNKDVYRHMMLSEPQEDTGTESVFFRTALMAGWMSVLRHLNEKSKESRPHTTAKE